MTVSNSSIRFPTTKSTAGDSLRQQCASILRRLQPQSPPTVHVDTSGRSRGFQFDCEHLPLLQELLSHIVGNQGCHELDVIVTSNAASMEIEFSTDAPAASDSIRSFATGQSWQRLLQLASSLGAKLEALPCPQGGMAYNVVISSGAISQRKAA